MKDKLTKINDTDFEGERLIFAQTIDGDYTIENKDYVQIGMIEKVRNGKWMHWSLVIPGFIMRRGKLSLTPESYPGWRLKTR